MSNLKIHIQKIKGIDDLVIELPVEKGLYAIAGTNGSGKTTVMACAARAFFTGMNLRDYFGPTDDDACLSFEYNGGSRQLRLENGKWISISENGDFTLKGFYEGSLIFGYRFRDASFSKLKRSANVSKKKLIIADDFIRTNLGLILQNDPNYYEKLYFVSHNYEQFDGTVFYYERKGHLVSQFHMSTGENLLLGILNTLYVKNRDKENLTETTLMFIDEVELALHPSSLQRLMQFLREMAEKYCYAFYFSTHSIVLLNQLEPTQIFYLQKYCDNKIVIKNPCHPYFATKYLYRTMGFDKVFLVEDVLAKEILWKILREEKLINNELVHVVPVGGWMAVLDLADEAIASGIFGAAEIVTILDLDIVHEAAKYIRSQGYGSLKVNYLPIESLEKYIRSKLYTSVDTRFYQYLERYLFVRTDLANLIQDYKNKYAGNDNNGKILYSYLEKELEEVHKSKRDIILEVMRYVFENEIHCVDKLKNFLIQNM